MKTGQNHINVGWLGVGISTQNLDLSIFTSEFTMGQHKSGEKVPNAGVVLQSKPPTYSPNPPFLYDFKLIYMTIHGFYMIYVVFI